MTKKQFIHEESITFVRECLKWTATGKSVTIFASSIGVARGVVYDWLSRYKNQVMSEALIQVNVSEELPSAHTPTAGLKVILDKINIELLSGYTPTRLQEVLTVIRSVF
jgi:hypothetical protein